MSNPNKLGPLVRLWGIRSQDLPPQTATADELTPFFTAILEEAIPFIDSAAPKSPSPTNNNNKLWKSKGSKSHPDSDARVEISERVVPARDLEAVAAGDEKKSKEAKARPETWCCRRSVHADAARRGTASWDEFERCFRDEHAQSESRFTPSVAAAREAARWRGCEGVVAEPATQQIEGEGEGQASQAWTHFGLALVEMRHKIGRPLLKDRTFPVLQMTCSLEGAREFLVVSIPVPDFDAAREKGARVALYVAVERVRAVPGTRDIEWLMATASDAGGALPMWVQTLAAPGVIWKDVPLFLGWIAKERGEREERGRDPEQGAETRTSAGEGASAGAGTGS
ncbi:hypothetical protein F4810DRAFT_684476 [Camillea tinctor]|nr:hypothetical protein F4810DRAFT_684476 [Camillea tinctor]